MMVLLSVCRLTHSSRMPCSWSARSGRNVTSMGMFFSTKNSSSDRRVRPSTRRNPATAAASTRRFSPTGRASSYWKALARASKAALLPICTSMAIRSSMGMWQCSLMPHLKLQIVGCPGSYTKCPPCFAIAAGPARAHQRRGLACGRLDGGPVFAIQSEIIEMGGQDKSCPSGSGEQVSFPQQPPATLVPPREDPSLLRIHADDQDKKTICLFWSLLIFLLVLLAVVANFAIPSIYVKNNRERAVAGTPLANCNPGGVSGTQLACSSNTLQFGDVVVGWGPVNQFGLLYLEAIPPSLSQSFSITQDYRLQLLSLRLKPTLPSGQNFFVVGKPSELNGTIDFSSDSAVVLYAEDGRTVVGYQYLLAIIINFDDNPFAEQVHFSQSLNINGTTLRLQSYAVNSRFTVYTIVVRYFFFALAVVGCVLYFLRFVRVPKERRTIEQKMVAVASVLLLMFNDPLYPLTVLKPNGASAFFSLLFVVNLIAFLLLLWLVAADRIYFEDGQLETVQLTKKKVGYVGVVWALLIICLMVYTMQQVDGSPIVPHNFARRYTAARVVIGLVVFCGMAYVGARFIRSCMAPEGRTWRSSLFMAFSSAFIVGVFIIVVSNALAPYNYSGSSILVVYALVNIYLYYLQYMFTITREEADRLDSPESPADPQDNYDVMTVGTIDLVDVNLDEGDEGFSRMSSQAEGTGQGLQKVDQKSDYEPGEFN